MPYSSCELLLESGSAGDDGPPWPKSGVGASETFAGGTLALASGSRLSGTELSWERAGESSGMGDGCGSSWSTVGVVSTCGVSVAGAGGGGTSERNGINVMIGVSNRCALPGATGTLDRGRGFECSGLGVVAGTRLASPVSSFSVLKARRGCGL